MTDSTADARALTDNIFFETTGMSADATIRQTQRALKGADGGELFMQHATGHLLSWSDGKLRSNTPSLSEGYSMRYVLDDAAGFAHGNDFSAKGLKEIAAGARAIRAHRQATGGIILPSPQRAGSLYTGTNPLADISEQARIKLLEDMDQKIRKENPEIQQVSMTIDTELELITIVRQDGRRLDDVRPMTRVSVSVNARGPNGAETGQAGYAARGTLSDFFNEVSMDTLAARAIAQLHTKMQAIPCPAGQMDVILGSGAAAVMLHEAVGHGLEGDANRTGASAFAGLVGQQVAARGVTVMDQGNIAGQRGALNFDDEGVETGQTVMIEDGILKGYIQDSMNARLMKVAPTGNGRRESYTSQPIPRMTTTFMLAGQHTKEEMIASVKGRALYAVQFAGGQVETASGKFVFAVNEGYLVEDGKIIAPVRGATLIGDCIPAMSAINMIGNDLVIDNGTWTCGKQGQSVPVGVGQPHLKMGGMTVGGTAPK
ncbi:MAG: peptidase modulator of gyrase [Micavibrio sp.]|nr:peptidase modulator of gyrase [Micavibrio sp.]